MGMFDWIKYEAPCRACGKLLTKFQSKDGPCQLDLLEPEAVDRFYDICDCGAWNEYRVKGAMIAVELVLPEDAEADMLTPPAPPARHGRTEP